MPRGRSSSHHLNPPDKRPSDLDRTVSIKKFFGGRTSSVCPSCPHPRRTDPPLPASRLTHCTSYHQCIIDPTTPSRSAHSPASTLPSTPPLPLSHSPPPPPNTPRLVPPPLSLPFPPLSSPPPGKNAWRCNYCGCVYIMSGDAKIIRGHLDNEKLGVETLDLRGSLHPMMSHAWSKVVKRSTAPGLP